MDEKAVASIIARIEAAGSQSTRRDRQTFDGVMAARGGCMAVECPLRSPAGH